MTKEILIFEYKGRVRIDLYKKITSQYGGRYKINIEENLDTDAFPDCLIQVFEVVTDEIKEVSDGKNKIGSDAAAESNVRTSKENEEWPEPVHS